MSPEASEYRRQSILGLPYGAKRLGALALHALATSYPGMVSRIIHGSLNTDYEYVGAGADCVAYKKADDSTVIKVRQTSMDLTETERQKLAKTLDEEHLPVASVLNGFIVPQAIGVGSHPVLPGLRAVLIRQQYRQVRDLKLFDPNDPTINYAGVHSAVEAYPGIGVQLADFVAASNELYNGYGVVPDVGGRNNLTVSAETDPAELILIDGQPLTNPEDTDRVRRQLDLLEVELSSF